MQKINVENKTALFLDHCRLINKIYNENVATKTCKYKLKVELFDFKPRPANEIKDKGNEKHVKRKRKHSEANVKETQLAAEMKEQQNSTAKFLTKLHEYESYPKAVPAQSLPRYWEEPNSFPKFNGANTNSNFQIVSFNECKYIIPPHCHFFNCDVLTLPRLLPQLPATSYDLIVLDPPWRNKYIRRLKRARQELAYTMLDNAQLQLLPIDRLIHRRTLVAIWCTNAQQHQDALMQQFLPAWQLRLLHSLKWLKLNTDGQLIGPFNVIGHKQPYELLYIACHSEAATDFATTLQEVEMLLSVPSIVHSHKPPLLPWLEQFLPAQPLCLEIFARYLQPKFTSVGLEVLKLMDRRLYEEVEDVAITFITKCVNENNQMAYKTVQIKLCDRVYWALMANGCQMLGCFKCISKREYIYAFVHFIKKRLRVGVGTCSEGIKELNKH